MNILGIVSRQLHAILDAPKNFLIRGIISGLIVTFFAIQLFVWIDLWWSDLMPLGSVKWRDIQFLLLTLIVAHCVSVLPVVSSSYILTLVLYHQAKRHKLTSAQSVFEGALVGAVTGITICIIGWFAINGRVDIQIFLTRTFFVTCIATFSAGWTAKNLADHIILKTNISNTDGTNVGV